MNQSKKDQSNGNQKRQIENKIELDTGFLETASGSNDIEAVERSYGVYDLEYDLDAGSEKEFTINIECFRKDTPLTYVLIQVHGSPNVKFMRYHENEYWIVPVVIYNKSNYQGMDAYEIAVNDYDLKCSLTNIKFRNLIIKAGIQVINRYFNGTQLPQISHDFTIYKNTEIIKLEFNFEVIYNFVKTYSKKQN